MGTSWFRKSIVDVFSMPDTMIPIALFTMGVTCKVVLEAWKPFSFISTYSYQIIHLIAVILDVIATYVIQNVYLNRLGAVTATQKDVSIS